MKDIKHIVEDIRGELVAAEHYAKSAAKLKDDRSADASAYADMSRQEMAHADQLHKIAVRMIEKYRETGAAVPPAMQAVWDWEHEQMMDRVARIKMLLIGI